MQYFIGIVGAYWAIPRPAAEVGPLLVCSPCIRSILLAEQGVSIISIEVECVRERVESFYFIAMLLFSCFSVFLCVKVSRENQWCVKSGDVAEMIQLTRRLLRLKSQMFRTMYKGDLVCSSIGGYGLNRSPKAMDFIIHQTFG